MARLAAISSMRSTKPLEQAASELSEMNRGLESRRLSGRAVLEEMWSEVLVDDRISDDDIKAMVEVYKTEYKHYKNSPYTDEVMNAAGLLLKHAKNNSLTDEEEKELTGPKTRITEAYWNLMHTLWAGWNMNDIKRLAKQGLTKVGGKKTRRHGKKKKSKRHSRTKRRH